MRIKRFNESLTDDINSFCNDNLSFLKDNGFTIYINNRKHSIEISIYTDDFEKYTWEDVRDDFIPFISLLNEKYNLTYGYVIFTDYGSAVSVLNKNFTVEEIVNDSIPYNVYFKRIVIYINPKIYK